MSVTERLALDERDRLAEGLHARQWRALCWLLAGIMWATGAVALAWAVVLWR